MRASTTDEPPLRILLQTTIVRSDDDWHVGRFSLLRTFLEGVTEAEGAPATVVARDREPDASGVDPVLAEIDESGFDQVWLFAVDVGGATGLHPEECAALGRFRRRGGAIMATRDHHDLGSSLCGLDGIGRAHYFHSTQRDPDASRNARDDVATADIDYPNYHSGANGDVQSVDAATPEHPVMRGVATLPAHPHEGGIGVPSDDPTARVVATGTSRVTGRPFTIAVAFEPGDATGRGWAESTFHHFCDYNWDVSAGCPTFVSEPPSDAIARDPRLLDDTKRYVRNLALWLDERL